MHGENIEYVFRVLDQYPYTVLQSCASLTLRTADDLTATTSEIVHQEHGDGRTRRTFCLYRLQRRVSKRQYVVGRHFQSCHVNLRGVVLPIGGLENCQ